MSTLESLFPLSAPIDAAATEATRADFAGIPAKPAVYLLTGRDAGDSVADHPLLLATVGNLRAALQRRLADTPPEIKSKRIAYSQIATRVFYRPVHSTFAANFYYAAAARTLFPQTAQALVPWATPTASWWLAVERPGITDFPRIRKTNNLTDPDLFYAGPVRDKHAANRLVESLEDLFDLCRYHQILVQAPHGKACAYKEMKKCPAPCDGTIPLPSYHQEIYAAWAFLTNAAPSPNGVPSARELSLPLANPRLAWRTAIEAQMKSAATRLEFETANRLKQRLSRAEVIHHEAFAHIAPLEQFSFLTLQRGKGKPWIEPWLIHGSQIQALPQFHRKELPQAAEALAGQVKSLTHAPVPLPPTPEQAGQIALVAHHLFTRPQNPSDVWLPTCRLPATAPDAAQVLLNAIDTFHTQLHPPTLIEHCTDTDIAEAPAQADASPAETPAP